MADNRRYRTNGAAAVDVYSTRYEGSAAVQMPQGLPAERPAPRPKKARRAKLEIAPFAVVGALVTLFLLMMVIQAQIRLFEYKSEESRLNAQVEELDGQLGKLRSEYESKVDLRSIETQAKMLGMRQPTASQTVYLSIAGADSAEVLNQQSKGYFGTLWDAISDGFRGIVEYFG